ncbi:MAG: DUF4956 domain-containing protein [Acidobacteria bacterium]|nr:DUF4956 domain-containing protein [Acidobacteriota bacterium]
MIEQLWDGLQGFGSGDMASLGRGALLLGLGVSLAASLFVAYLYQVFYRARATGSQVHHAFPLMGLAITAIFISVQFSLPLSLGLLGALSIVRFRTPIKEPEEIGFILLVIATSLTAATFNLGFLALLLGVAVAALLVMRMDPSFLSRRKADGMFMATLPAGADPDALDKVVGALKAAAGHGTIDSITESEDEVAVAFRIARMKANDTPELIRSVKEAAPGVRTSVFFYRAGDV